MAFLAPAIPWLEGAGAAVAAYGAVKQGQAAQAAANYNAQVATQDATIARQDATMQATQQQRENRLREGTIIANAAASGGTVGGSALDVLSDAARQGEMTRQNILYQGELKARGFTNTSTLEKFSGANAAAAGNLAAAKELIGGAISAYNAYKRLS